MFQQCRRVHETGQPHVAATLSVGGIELHNRKSPQGIGTGQLFGSRRFFCKIGLNADEPREFLLYPGIGISFLVQLPACNAPVGIEVDNDGHVPCAALF